MAARNEKDLPAQQSPPKAHARLHGAHGNTERTQCAQATAQQGAQTSDRLDPAKAAGLAKPAGFSRDHRLRRSADFLRVQRRGARSQSEHFVVYCLKADAQCGGPRLGITVSRRIGGAVIRNRVKRRVRECFRQSLKRLILPAADLVVIARPGAGELSTAAMNDQLKLATLSLQQRLTQ